MRILHIRIRPVHVRRQNETERVGERERSVESIDHRDGAEGGDGLARTPVPPYWAVIFSTHRDAQPGDRYDQTAQRMMTLAAEQAGFLGVETAHSNIGITVSYWRDEASIAAWKRDADHAFAQYEGRTRWYDAYELRVAQVARAYSFRREGP
jgi:heme-degrading monooxygenase HmoA